MTANLKQLTHAPSLRRRAYLADGLSGPLTETFQLLRIPDGFPRCIWNARAHSPTKKLLVLR